MVAAKRKRGSLVLAGASLLMAAGLSVYSQWSGIVQVLDSARNLIAVLNEAIEVKKEVREAAAKMEVNRQQAVEIMRIVRDLQRLAYRKAATGCDSTRHPF